MWLCNTLAMLAYISDKLGFQVYRRQLNFELNSVCEKPLSGEISAADWM